MSGRRLHGFRTDASMPSDALWQEPFTVDDVSFRPSAEPGPDRDAAIAEMKQEMVARAANLEPAAATLRELIAQHEPVEFVMAVAATTSMGLIGSDDDGLLDDGAQTHSWPAKIEYLLGLALSVPPGTGSTPWPITETAMELIADVFDAAHARRMIDAFDRPAEDNESLDHAVFLLGQEHLIDRMPGYPVHLEHIDAAVFDRHRDFYVATIGFNPADVTRIVRRRTAVVSKRFNDARHGFASAHRAHDDAGRARGVATLLGSLNDARLWSPASISQDTGVSVEEVLALLRLFSTTFESQPEFRLPTDPNLASTRPCVELSGDGDSDQPFFVADAWALSAAVHPRLAEVLDGSHRERYQRHREQGHERLVHAAFSKVFGSAAVSNLHYDAADAAGEIDELVVCERPLVAEAKAHSLTPSGRRGAPRRVERVATAAIGEAIGQAARVREYILGQDGRAFSTAQGGPTRVVLPQRVDGIEEIVVTFERMDPLAIEGAGIVGDEHRRPWTVCIADLLMLADILTDPAAFHHYARTRRRALELGVTIYMEADALGGYLIDRLATHIDAAQQDPESQLVLDSSSWAINDFYNRLESDLATSPPSTGVPVAVRDVLTETFGVESDGAWEAAVDAVMTAPIDVWKRWKRFVRRHRSPTTKTFTLTDEVKLAIGDPGIARNDDDTVAVVVPATARANDARR